VWLAISGSGREVELQPASKAGEAWLAAMAQDGQLGGFPEP